MTIEGEVKQPLLRFEEEQDTVYHIFTDSSRDSSSYYAMSDIVNGRHQNYDDTICHEASNCFRRCRRYCACCDKKCKRSQRLKLVRMLSRRIAVPPLVLCFLFLAIISDCVESGDPFGTAGAVSIRANGEIAFSEGVEEIQKLHLADNSLQNETGLELAPSAAIATDCLNQKSGVVNATSSFPDRVKGGEHKQLSPFGTDRDINLKDSYSHVSSSQVDAIMIRSCREIVAGVDAPVMKGNVGKDANDPILPSAPSTAEEFHGAVDHSNAIGGQEDETVTVSASSHEVTALPTTTRKEYTGECSTDFQFYESETQPQENAGRSDAPTPFRTLKNQEKMLDDTDYATATVPPTSNSLSHTTNSTQYGHKKILVDSIIPNKESLSSRGQTLGNAYSKGAVALTLLVENHDALWISKGRSNHKKRQRRPREEKLDTRGRHENGQLEKRETDSDDDEMRDFADDDLGYTLPNLPIYFGHGEPDEFNPSPISHLLPKSEPANSDDLRSRPRQTSDAQSSSSSHGVPKNVCSELTTVYDLPSYHLPPTGISFPSPPLPAYGCHQGDHHDSENAGWVPSVGAAEPPYSQQHRFSSHHLALPPPGLAQLFGNDLGAGTHVRDRFVRINDRMNNSGTLQKDRAQTAKLNARGGHARADNEDSRYTFEMGVKSQNSAVLPTAPWTYPNFWGNSPSTLRSSTEGKVASLAEAGTKLSFDSLQKILFSVMGVVVLSYCAVSPRTLPPIAYNRHFKNNLQITCLIFISPIFVLLSIFDVNENDINSIVHTFYTAFTMGYAVSFVLEIALTTILRLAVFAIWEPNVFELTSDVPLLILPWTLRENKYKPKRITLFVADFITSCATSVVVEELVKLGVVNWSAKLPKNYILRTRKRHGNKRKRAKVEILEPAQRRLGEQDVSNANSYVCHMLASSLGLKLADSIRRAMMYTKKDDVHKEFYAFCRGLFPIHELCGTLTALQLAKRDVLGLPVPLWKIILPAVVIHGIANFRGMKPVFKWNSATPWSEMQMSPLNLADDSTFFEILCKGFAKLVWVSILARVLSSCVKNYYMIGRQSVNRTTTHASNHAAISAAAELNTCVLLKKAKDGK